MTLTLSILLTIRALSWVVYLGEVFINNLLRHWLNDEGQRIWRVEG